MISWARMGRGNQNFAANYKSVQLVVLSVGNLSSMLLHLAGIQGVMQ